MGQSAGAGSPIWFLCPRLRRSLHPDGARFAHRVTLTGRRRRYRPPKGSAMGQRSTFVSREYECSCGHVGWSNHIDLARMEGHDRDTRLEDLDGQPLA